MGNKTGFVRPGHICVCLCMRVCVVCVCVCMSTHVTAYQLCLCSLEPAIIEEAQEHLWFVQGSYFVALSMKQCADQKICADTLKSCLICLIQQ